MTNEKKKITGKHFAIGCLGVFLIMVLIAVIFVFGIFNFRSTVVSLENRIDAQYTANQSNYDNMWKKFKEMTQVTDIQADQFKEVYTDLISGRYEDPDLLFKMVSEQNPSLGTEVYTTLQLEIASGRTVFDNNQAKIVDMVREYNTYINTGLGYFYNFIFNYEQIDTDKFIVTSELTQKTFDSGKSDELQLR